MLHHRLEAILADWMVFLRSLRHGSVRVLIHFALAILQERAATEAYIRPSEAIHVSKCLVQLMLVNLS